MNSEALSTANMARRRPDVTLIAHLVVLVGLSFLFSRTPGLAYREADGRTQFTSELQSSGSDDNASIGLGAGIFGLAVVVAAMPTRSLRGWAIKCVPLMGLWLLQLALVPPEVGSIGFTITETTNVVLALWLVAVVLLPLTLGYGLVYWSRWRPAA